MNIEAAALYSFQRNGSSNMRNKGGGFPSSNVNGDKNSQYFCSYYKMAGTQMTDATNFMDIHLDIGYIRGNVLLGMCVPVLKMQVLMFLWIISLLPWMVLSMSLNMDNSWYH